MNLWPFFITQILSKISCFASVHSYVSDVTVSADRSLAFGQVSGCVFLALTLGPFLAKYVSLLHSFFLAAIISVINLIYIAFFLPESVDVETERALHYAYVKGLGDRTHTGERKPLMGTGLSLFLFPFLSPFLSHTFAHASHISMLMCLSSEN